MDPRQDKCNEMLNIDMSVQQMRVHIAQFRHRR